MNWKKISAFAPMLTVVVLAACMGKTLKGYTPVVYDVKAEEIPLQSENTETTDQQEKQSNKKKKKETEKKQKASKGNFDLKDGTYTGEGQGFGGIIKVSVVIKDKTITSITVESADGEDAAFFGRAKGVIDKILAEQKTDVDVVSGATYSSRGIMSAVKNALTGEKDTSTPPAATGSASAASGSGKINKVEENKNQTYKDGTYYGSGTGFGGTVKVKVVIKKGKIRSIQITQHQDGSTYMQKASALIDTVIKKQSTNVDSVSGATYSSAGLVEAIRDALDQAKTTEKKKKKKTTSKKNQNTDTQTGNATPQTTGKIPYKDGIYYGTGEGYLGNITVGVVIQNKTITSIVITENEADDETFLNKAKAVIDKVVQKQSTDVDTVSGATYSSKGILEAITNALENAKKATEGKETEKPSESEKPKPSETEKPAETEKPSESESETPKVYADGDYTASAICTSGEDSFTDYNLFATVTIKNDKITAISNIYGDDNDSVNKMYIGWAANGRGSAKGIVSQILEKNSTDGIDTVTRATCSSKALIEACQQAVSQAKLAPQNE